MKHNGVARETRACWTEIARTATGQPPGRCPGPGRRAENQDSSCSRRRLQRPVPKDPPHRSIRSPLSFPRPAYHGHRLPPDECGLGPLRPQRNQVPTSNVAAGRHRDGPSRTSRRSDGSPRTIELYRTGDSRWFRRKNPQCTPLLHVPQAVSAEGGDVWTSSGRDQWILSAAPDTWTCDVGLCDWLIRLGRPLPRGSGEASWSRAISSGRTYRLAGEERRQEGAGLARPRGSRQPMSTHPRRTVCRSQNVEPGRGRTHTAVHLDQRPQRTLPPSSAHSGPSDAVKRRLPTRHTLASEVGPRPVSREITQTYFTIRV